MLSNILSLNDSCFEREVSRPGLFIVYFWSPSCAPCKVASACVERIAEKFSGLLSVGKANVLECPRMVEKYSVLAVPTFLFFANGVLVERIVGFSGEGRILDTVREILLKCPVASTFG